MSTNFDKWWSTHKHLFIEEPTHVEEITSPEQLIIDGNSRYFKIDTRMKVEDTIRSLRTMVSTHGKIVEKRTAKWVVNGEMRQEKLFNCYNCLVMWLQGGDNESILKSGLFRMSRGQKVEWFDA